MEITKLKVAGFRCFPDAGVEIDIEDFNVLIGANASGKTAAMVALSRMFGETQNDRTIVPEDFHLSDGEGLDEQPERTLTLEVLLRFAELDGDADSPAVPEFFRHMIVDGPEGEIFCRAQLEATWTRDGSVGGNVEQDMYWVPTLSTDADEVAELRKRMTALQRSRIQVVYVPASRDPGQQVRRTTASKFGRLVAGLEWGDHRDSISERLEELGKEVGQLAGLAMLSEYVGRAWRSLYRGQLASEFTFQSFSAEPADLLEHLTPSFSPTAQGRSMPFTALSDGLRSLFALSLPLGLSEVERTLAGGEVDGFNADVRTSVPLLTLLAVEEPENHLAPHYLGPTIKALKEFSDNDTVQVVVSSHAPAIMRRVPPESVRFFYGGDGVPVESVKRIVLPETDDEAFKFVREAVRGYPELYFAKLVILAEGPSEEIVLRRIFEASDAPLDTCFISVVPLGGRHVNHFWRLLDALEIPYLTLLDLDREKHGAGWGRLQYVRDQLLALDRGDEEFETNGNPWTLNAECFQDLSTKDDTDVAQLGRAAMLFQNHFDVFFSSPLDLDFSMLGAFPRAYQRTAPQGPTIPADEADRRAFQEKRRDQVLSCGEREGGGSSYTVQETALFPWYKYLFLDGSKPVTHFQALLNIDDETLLRDCPEVLKALLARARELVGEAP